MGIDSFFSIGKFSTIYFAFLILHFVFASLSLSIGSLSYFFEYKFSNFWHHFFYFFVFITCIGSCILSFMLSSFEKFFLAINLILLVYLPIQKRGIHDHTKLGFAIFGFALISLLIRLKII